MSLVYVIGPTEGPQKIGLAVAPATRLARLQTGHPERLVVAFEREVPDAASVESFAHWLLRDHRSHGEWFRVSRAEAVAAVEKAIAAVARGEKQGRKGVGRPKLWSEVMQAKFAEGTFARIARLLADGEDRTDFVREAVEREIKRRERAKP